MKPVRAIYEEGVFRPTEPVDLPESAVVELHACPAADGKLVEPTDEDCASAWIAYGSSRPGSAGIVDQVSFAVMRRLDVLEAFTNDRHFRTAGFVTLF